MVEKEVRNVEKGVESNMVAFDFEKTPITQIADYIIITASKSNTSDIHFDPREDGMMVRFRIDGDLQDYTFIPKTYERNLTTRLKLLANMNITESRLPQDGAIKGDFGGKYLDMRVSALPLNEGEKIVIRILDYTRSLQGIDALGFNPSNLVKLKRMMGVPNGIILVTGATGSGKSTTTYSILQGLNKPETNIITVEDPIEMNIEGMNQVQVNAEIGMTFAAALRSILRQDPNVILIGEIRDSETAQIAVRASITGHLVLSTIHTNDSLNTIERLLDMEVERYLLASALTGIISQKLARKLCPECKKLRPTNDYEKDLIKKVTGKEVNEIYEAVGCDHCKNGYSGRLAIHEVLLINQEIKDAISSNMKKEDLRHLVYSSDVISLLKDGVTKVLEGLTTLEELLKLIELEDDEMMHTTGLENAIKENEIADQSNNNEVTISNNFEETKEDPIQDDIINEIFKDPVVSTNTDSNVINEQPIEEINTPVIEEPTEEINTPIIEQPIEENIVNEEVAQNTENEIKSSARNSFFDTKKNIFK